jgi:hypothetical protein
MCTAINGMEYSLISKNDACISPIVSTFYVSPLTSPAVGQSLFTDSGCTISVSNGWYIDANVDPNVVYVVTGGAGLITSTETCSTPTPTPTPTVTQTPTPTLCDCVYVNVTITQQDIDAASGNTNPSLNGVVSYQYNVCGSPSPQTTQDYTVSGTYLNSVCVKQSQVGSSNFFYSQQDNIITSGTSSFIVGGCCTAPTPTPTPTVTTTPTNTVTPTNTITPTVTPTITNTPSVTPTVTPTDEPFDIYSFKDCCDSSNIFRYNNITGTLITGQIFYIDGGTGFNGCAEVLPYISSGIIYSGGGVSFTEQTTCNDILCPACPTPTPTPTGPVVSCTCFEYLLFNNNSIVVYVDMVDCYGNDQQFPIPANTTFSVCACENSVIAPAGVYVTLVGECPSPSATVQATPTPTPTPSLTPSAGWNLCPVEEYCVLTYFPTTELYDGTYYSAGTYNTRVYYSGSSAFIYYSTGTTSWCLSTTLGGSCILHGKIPNSSICPDLCDELFSSGTCVTTTSTTSPCDEIGRAHV